MAEPRPDAGQDRDRAASAWNQPPSDPAPGRYASAAKLAAIKRAADRLDGLLVLGAGGRRR